MLDSILVIFFKFHWVQRKRISTNVQIPFLKLFRLYKLDYFRRAAGWLCILLFAAPSTTRRTCTEKGRDDAEMHS